MKSLPQRQSLVSQTAEILREEMCSGRWTEFLPGERALSTMLRISRPTLRAALEVLRREKRIEVSQGQRRRIRVSVPPNRKPPKTNAVVLLTPMPPRSLPPFVLFWIDELRQRLADHEFELRIELRSMAETARPGSALQQLAADTPAAAWVLLLSNEPTQRWFAQNDIPCAVAGSCFPDVHLPSVDIDLRSVCRHAAGLFFARGHQRIALILPEARTGGDRASEAGFREGIANLKAADQSPVIVHHKGTAEDVCAIVDRLIAGPKPCTAFLVARSVHALTALTHLQRRGVTLPENVALISRDNDEFLDFAVPKITRYACNPMIFAARLSRIVLQLAKDNAVAPKQVLLFPDLIKGETIE